MHRVEIGDNQCLTKIKGVGVSPLRITVEDMAVVGIPADLPTIIKGAVVVVGIQAVAPTIIKGTVVVVGEANLIKGHQIMIKDGILTITIVKAMAVGTSKLSQEGKDQEIKEAGVQTVTNKVGIGVRLIITKVGDQIIIIT